MSFRLPGEPSCDPLKLIGLEFTGNSAVIGTGGVIMNPCGTECGDTELCDDAAVALDENCDGQVDEGCPCTSGTARACFKGDPSYLGADGCNPGTMKCTELGQWGPCEGGQHATDMCFSADQTGCHSIHTAPFVPANLKDGTGNFSNDAVTESKSFLASINILNCSVILSNFVSESFNIRDLIDSRVFMMK